MPKRKQTKKEDKEIKTDEDSKIFAFIATFFSIVGFVIALVARRKDKYVMHYAKQSLILFVFFIVFGIIKGIFSWVPITGKIIEFGLGIFGFILWIISWAYALSGEFKEVPVVWEFAKKIDL